jgi:hypothetical protein
MAILLDSPRGKGYLACEMGLPPNVNPYRGLQFICESDEWASGWQEAYYMNKFGTKEKNT